MTDNVTGPLTGSGDATAVIATDDIGGAHYQRVKIAWGVDGAAVDASASNPLPTVDSAGNTSLSSIDGKTPALGQALAAASVPVVLTAAQVSTLTPPAAITGFATAANQATELSSLSSIDGKLPALVSSRVPVDGSGVTQPVSGTVTASPNTSASANNPGASVSVTSSTTVLASYASRKAATIYSSPSNTADVYIKLGATATSSNFPLSPGDSLALNQGGSVYTGVVDAIAASGTQTIKVVEW